MGRGFISMFILRGGKYWRFDYRFADKRKTLALGVYPDVSLADARASHQSAREQLSSGIDPSESKRVQKLTQHLAATDSFEAVAREWFSQKMKEKSDSYRVRTLRILEKVPFFGQ